VTILFPVAIELSPSSRPPPLNNVEVSTGRAKGAALN
jgi:hypothetical protein